MPRIGTRPVIASLASVIRRSWRRVGGSRPGRKHAKTVIISGMGGGSSCRVGLGNPDSTCCRRSTHLHFYTVLSRPASLPFLAKVLFMASNYFPDSFQTEMRDLSRRTARWLVELVYPGQGRLNSPSA